MRFAGRVYKDGKFWLAEVPIFEATTQGRSRNEAFLMVSDWFETMANEPGFRIDIVAKRGEIFHITAEDTRTLIRLLLQRRREISGLSLGDVAKRLGAKSRNAYARYESGRSVPTFDKLDELLQAVSPGKDFVIQETVVS